MYELKKEALNAVAARLATMANGSFTVTNESTFKINNLVMKANEVIDLNTGAVLFDGTQKSFCFQGTSYSVKTVQGGHSYTPGKNC